MQEKCNQIAAYKVKPDVRGPSFSLPGILGPVTKAGQGVSTPPTRPKCPEKTKHCPLRGLIWNTKAWLSPSWFCASPLCRNASSSVRERKAFLSSNFLPQIHSTVWFFFFHLVTSYHPIPQLKCRSSSFWWPTMAGDVGDLLRWTWSRWCGFRSKSHWTEWRGDTSKCCLQNQRISRTSHTPLSSNQHRHSHWPIPFIFSAFGF